MRYVMPLVWGFVVAFLLGFGLKQLENAAGEPLGMVLWMGPMFFGALTAFVLANLAGNRKVATAFGITVPSAVVLRASRVIE